MNYVTYYIESTEAFIFSFIGMIIWSRVSLCGCIGTGRGTWCDFPYVVTSANKTTTLCYMLFSPDV